MYLSFWYRYVYDNFQVQNIHQTPLEHVVIVTDGKI